MKLDRSLLHDPAQAIWNEMIGAYLEHNLIYVKNELPRSHRRKLHIQPGLEINITHAGKAAVVLENEVYVQSCRQVIVFLGSIPHEIFPDASTRFRRSVICISEELLRFALDDKLVTMLKSNRRCIQLQLRYDMYKRMSSIIAQMHHELKYAQEGWQSMLVSRFLELTVLLQRSYSLHSKASIEDTRASVASCDLVRQCCNYVADHLSDELSLQSMSKLFSISPEHLTRTFRKEKGMSFYQYVLQQRISASQPLLVTERDLSITEIALSLGFKSSNQFSHTFKSMTGVTPTQYRLRSACSNADEESVYKT